VLFRWARRRKRRDEPGEAVAEPIVPAQLPSDAATVPTPVQPGTASETPVQRGTQSGTTAEPATDPEVESASDDRVTVDVTEHRDGAQESPPPADTEALPDDWFRRSDASS
jgi:hypothetical protein